ncbi:hypothetical protein MasN3_05980 [Massilia varians]|uniref:DUF3617 domain-containing protein n=1 Tax=Massilia varians TaxID=457921 RepID=A0ABN6T8N0_9BURK|nr:hypothetical protein [Massilia varians]BDT57104.1 hypothetical protein MasN3_05980 [Massilia varians]
MRKIAMTVVATCGLVSLTFAADSLGTWQPLQEGRYKIFSGETVAYGEAPTAKDRKLSIVVKGQAAKEIFDSIGSDARDICSSEKGDRERNRGGVQCMYKAKDASSPGKGYRCWIGVDLTSGQGAPTVSC